MLVAVLPRAAAMLTGGWTGQEHVLSVTILSRTRAHPDRPSGAMGAAVLPCPRFAMIKDPPGDLFFQCPSDAITTRAEINAEAWRRGALSGQLGLLALQISTGGSWFPDKDTCNIITLCSKGCWHFLALRYQLAVRKARARRQAERDVEQPTTAGAAASSSSAAAAEPPPAPIPVVDTSGTSSGSTAAGVPPWSVPPHCACCGRTTCARIWVGQLGRHLGDDWTAASARKKIALRAMAERRHGLCEVCGNGVVGVHPARCGLCNYLLHWECAVECRYCEVQFCHECLDAHRHSASFDLFHICRPSAADVAG